MRYEGQPAEQQKRPFLLLPYSSCSIAEKGCSRKLSFRFLELAETA